MEGGDGEGGAFTSDDEALATKMCGFLGGAIQTCLIAEQLFKQSILTRVVDTILRLPDHSLTDITLLSSRLGEVLSKLLDVEGAKLFTVRHDDEKQGGGGGGKDGVTVLWCMEEGGGERRRSSSLSDGRRLEVSRESITGEALFTGRAMVVANVREDNRYNRSCDRSDGFFGKCRVGRLWWWYYYYY